MARRTREEALKTRESILDAAIEVFHIRGVAKPSLTDIARLAGVTRGAVYGHFRNKSDVFNALCDRVHLPLEAICRQEDHAAPEDPLGLLREGWIGFLRETAANREQRRILDIIIHRCELLEENGQILQRLQQGRREGMQRMELLLRQAVERGQLPADLDVDRALHLFHAALAGLLAEWLFDTTSMDLQLEAESAVDALIDMLSSAPSLRLRSRQTDRGPVAKPGSSH